MIGNFVFPLHQGWYLKSSPRTLLVISIMLIFPVYDLVEYDFVLLKFLGYLLIVELFVKIVDGTITPFE